LKEKAAELFDVVRRGDANRKSGLQRNDARRLPAAQQRALESLILRHRQLPNVAENETVPRVVKRRAVGGIEVQRIEGAFEAGGIIQRFAEGIGRLELQSMRVALLEHGLQ